MSSDCRFTSDESPPAPYPRLLSRWERRCLYLSAESYREVLSNKFIFWSLVREFAPTPQVVARIVRSHLQIVEPRAWDLLWTASDLTHCFIKPEFGGGGGRGIALVGIGQQSFRDTEGKRIDTLERFTSPAYVVTPRVSQHEFLERLAPHTSNTVRIITCRDKDGWFVLGSMLKLGTLRSWPVDHVVRGGIGVAVDDETGRLGLGRDRRGRVLRQHPESKQPFVGAILPHWGQVLKLLHQLHDALPYVTYVRWDILITENGACVIEGNSAPNAGMLQMHGALVKNERTARYVNQYTLPPPKCS